VFILLNWMGLIWVILEVWIQTPPTISQKQRQQQQKMWKIGAVCEKCGLVLRIACRYVLLVYQIVCYLLAMRVAVGYGIGVHMVDNVGDSEVECLLLPCLRLTTDTYAAAAAAGGAAVSVNANMFWWWQYLWLSAVCTVVYVCECVLQLVPSLSSWFCTRR